jgi:Spy/CpxP family protein refolding chaperone
MRRRLTVTTALMALFLGFFALPNSSTDAATATTQPTSRTGTLEKVKKALGQLDLSTQQKSKIRSIVEVARTKLKELKSQGTTATNKQQARTIVKAAVEQIAGTLTPVQKTKFEQLLTAKKASHATDGV